MADDNPHLAVVRAHQQRRAFEAEADLARLRRQDEDAKSKVLQLEILNDTMNPHALIIARHAARKAAEEREAAEQAALKEKERASRELAKAKTKSEEQLEQAAAAKLLPTREGKLALVEDKHSSKERFVVLKDNTVTMATLSLYEGDAATAEALSLEIPVDGACAVEDYVAPSGLTATLTMRKAKPRPNAFSVFVGSKCWTFDASSPEDKAAWKEALQAYFQKYAPLPSASDPNKLSVSGDTHRRTPSGSSLSALANKTLKRMSAQPAPKAQPVLEASTSEEVVNPLMDDMLNVTFENKLFTD